MNQTPSAPLSLVGHPPGPRRRHWARVTQFSSNVARLEMLDAVAADEVASEALTRLVCEAFNVPLPRLRFHARRSPYTGACERPRSVWVAILGEPDLAWREANGWGVVPDEGAIRLGRTTTLMTLSHELGHHVVFHLDPADTPAHGKRWVARFDQVAQIVERFVE